MAENEKRPSVKMKLNEIRELILDGHLILDSMELKRQEVYVERSVQRLLRDLVERGKETEILPTYDPAYGFRYKSIEPFLNENAPPKTAEEILERLCGLEILIRKFSDAVSTCPACGSTSITSHYHCPKCASHHIVKTSLTEHVPCGNIDEKERYNQGLTCPKCGAKLTQDEYRDMGLWYICRECGEKFEHPGVDLICRQCNNRFTIGTATIKEVYSYSLNPDREKEVRQNVASLESIHNVLAELGFVFETSPSAIGERSGIEHTFSLIARRESRDSEIVAVIDHAVGESEVNASSLIFFIYKISEVKVDLPIFVAIPKLSVTAKRIAQGYNILIVEGIPQEQERLKSLRDEIQERLAMEDAVKQPPNLDISHRRKDIGISFEAARKVSSEKTAPLQKGMRKHEHTRPKLFGRFKRSREKET